MKFLALVFIIISVFYSCCDTGCGGCTYEKFHLKYKVDSVRIDGEEIMEIFLTPDTINSSSANKPISFNDWEWSNLSNVSLDH